MPFENWINLRGAGHIAMHDLHRRAIPNFHEFLMHRLDHPRNLAQFGAAFFLRPLEAGSFHEFWRRWNPPYLYVLLFSSIGSLRANPPSKSSGFALEWGS